MLYMCAHIILYIAYACTFIIVMYVYTYFICYICALHSMYVWIMYHMLYMCVHMCVHIHTYSFFSKFNFYRNRLMMDLNIVFVKNVLGEWVLEEIQL